MYDIFNICWIQIASILIRNFGSMFISDCCSVTQSCPTFYDTMDWSTAGYPVLHCLLECAQTHVHWISDAIQPTIKSSVVAFSSCFQSFPASGSFPVSQLFASGGQSIEDSASVTILPMNIQSWFPLGLTSLISLLSKDSQDSSPAPQFKSINSLGPSLLHGPTLISIHD